MSNTLSITVLESGDRKVTVHSSGERDLSAVLSADALDALVRSAQNAHSRGDVLPEVSSLPAEAKETGADTPTPTSPPEKAGKK